MSIRSFSCSNHHFSRVIKVQLVGNVSTGKTSFFHHVQSLFPSAEPYPSFSPPSDLFALPDIKLGPHRWQVRLSDTSGQERFYSTPNSCIRDATAFLILYRTDSLESFSDVRSFWLQIISQYNALPFENGPVLLLLGNHQRDKECELQVTSAEVEALCTEFSAGVGPVHIASHRVVDTSSGYGVQESIKECFDRIQSLLSSSEDCGLSLSLTGTIDFSGRSYAPGDIYREKQRQCC